MLVNIQMRENQVKTLLEDRNFVRCLLILNLAKIMLIMYLYSSSVVSVEIQLIH